MSSTPSQIGSFMMLGGLTLTPAHSAATQAASRLRGFNF